MQEHSELQLARAFERLADGDRSAFAPVFRILWPKIRQFCRQALGNDADADDAAQHALSKLFEQAHDYDPDRSPLAWAYAIAIWECRTLRRIRSRSRSVPLEDIEFDPSLSPERRLEEKDLGELLEESIRMLPVEDQSTLQMVLRSDSPQDGTFRKRKQRALARLKALWKGAYGL